MILDRDRSALQIARHAALLYRLDWPRYVLLAALVVVPADLLVLGIGLGELTASYGYRQSEAAAYVSIALYLVTYPLATAMAIALLLDRLGERDLSIARAARAGFELFAPALVVALLVVAAVLAGLLLIVPGVFLAVRLAAAIPAVVVEGRRGTDALGRSWTLTDGAFWHTAATWLVVGGTIVLFIVLVIGLPAEALARWTDAYGVLMAGAIVVDALALPYAGIASALLFGSLRARRAAVAPAAA